jgi:hypothetical protein
MKKSGGFGFRMRLPNRKRENARKLLLPASGDVAKTFFPQVQPSSHIPEIRTTNIDYNHGG